MTPPGAVPPNDATILSSPPEPANTILDNATVTPVTGVASGWSKPLPTQAGALSGAPVSTLQPGTTLGNRYELLTLLGEGGMGAVYKARDIELDRMVALKVIRPELAKQPEILQRFKQELILARKVTHRNVVRIFDLGEADGIKFITMEFIEGHDLKSVLVQDGKLPVDRVIDVIQQVCLALETAHTEGVVHRDLKPQNIMIDKQRRVAVMDFGIARSMELGGMTQTGALIGTPEYMSPEQVRGEHVDARSDLFTLGIICCEVLSGKLPYQADTAMASMFKRTMEPAISIDKLDSSVPPYLVKVVAKSLEIDPKDRFQSAREIYDALETWKSGSAAPISVRSRRWTRRLAQKPLLVGSAAAVVLLAGLGFFLRDKLPFRSSGSPAPVQARSLAVLPFRNASGDSSLNWLGSSLADMLSTDVGQSPSLHTTSPDRLQQVLSDLKITPDMAIDPTTISRVAEFSSADTIVWGQYARFADQIRIDATLLDIKHDRRTPLRIEAASEKEIPHAVDSLADLIRKNLAVSADELRELKASSFQPTTKSMQALREYTDGITKQRGGDSLEAQKQYEAATKEDPTFALAFSKLAQTYVTLGFDNEAEQAAQRAVELSQDLPDAEKYLIAAVRAQVTRNLPEAIKAYGKLAQASPDNTDVQAALADLYEQSGDLVKAGEYNQKILAANPKDISATLTQGRLAINSGKPQAGLDSLNRALTLSIQLDNQEQKARSLHLIGVAYWRMNKPQEALRNYQEELPIWRQIGQKRGLALSLNETAKVQALLGDNKNALSNFQLALDTRREIGDKRGLGSTLIDLGNFNNERGDHDQALKMYKEALQIQRDISNERLQAICLNNIGAVYFEKGQYEDARAFYEQALQLREKGKVPNDIVQSIQNLADTSVRMGQYDQAISEYMHALELWRSMNDSRGSAITSNTLGMMLDMQGRFGAALNSRQEAVKTFQGLKDKTTWMAEVGGGYGESLVLAGRSDEAKPYLDDALSLSRELKNDGMISQSLDYQGDAAYYKGDMKSARALYDQALQAAARSKEPARILTVKAGLARIASSEDSPQQAISSLRQLVQQADEQGVPNISIDCSISIAQAMIRSHDYVHAQQQLERTLLRADKLSLKPLSARAQYLLGNSLRASGNKTEAQQHYREALQLLDGMRKEPGAEKILQRSDFKLMYDESSRLT